MNHDQAKELLKALGSSAQSQSEVWVRGACPLAPWLHSSGKDSRPSFGLYIRPGKPSSFHCFACESGSLSSLLQLIEYHHQRSPGLFHGNLNKAREIVDNEWIGLPVLGDYMEFTGPAGRQYTEIPESVLYKWPQAHEVPRAIEYLHHRGFTQGEAVHWKLRYDPWKDRLVFPYWDVFGRFAGARGRGIQLPGEPVPDMPHFDYSWGAEGQKKNNTAITWFNEQVLNQSGPVLVVEGQFDCLRASRVYPRTIANLTAKPTTEKIKKLVHAEGVILMLDGDETGVAATEKFIEALTELNVQVVPIYLPTNIKKSDPDNLGEKFIQEALVKVGAL